jgi:putative FmdB family regulatory protein
MPLYEFRCRACSRIFEVLVRGSAKPSTCPACNATDLEQLISLFAVDSASTRKSALESGRKHNRKAQLDKAVADREEIEHHRH